jgi:hypothetical protein
MIGPLSSPWILRMAPGAVEVRLLVHLGRGARSSECPAGETGLADDELGLHWEARETNADGTLRRALLQPTRLGADIALAAFRVGDYAGTGARYRISCGRQHSPWISIPADPCPGETWRFLILSDHQLKPGSLVTAKAVARTAGQRPFHGLLFPGDLVDVPDDAASWFGRPDGLSFFDSLAAPATELFRDTPEPREVAAGLPLLSATPIFVCPGNHEISFPEAVNAKERVGGVAPGGWDIRTFSQLFRPAASRPGWYAAAVGPLDLLSLFVCRRWVPGVHETRGGPCYEHPGRFIFEPIHPGSPQYEWLAGRVGSEGGSASLLNRGAEPDHAWQGCLPLRVALLHHPPFAQGCNALPLFGKPVEYKENLIATHLVPLLERWADLVLSGHNHAVNHHRIDGVHYFESSHMASAFRPARQLSDGRPAAEPLGHPALFFASEEGFTFFSTLEVTAEGAGRSVWVRTYRVHSSGVSEEEYAFEV